MSKPYKYYKERPYKIKSNGKEYTYEELKEYFFIDGSEVVCCIRDFGECKSGKYYLLIIGGETGNIYIIDDTDTYVTWRGKEYMKENVKVSLSFSPNELSILSKGLFCLIMNANEARNKIYDMATIDSLDRGDREYQRINKKICDAVPGME